MIKNKKIIIPSIITIISLLLFIIMKVVTRDRDSFIIDNGIQAANFVALLSKVCLGLISISLIIIVIFFIMAKKQTIDEVKRDKVEQETNVFYHEKEYVNKLKKEILDTDRNYRLLGERLLSQLEELNSQFSDFNEVSENYNYDIINSVNATLIDSKLQMLDRMKSCTNRIIVEGEPYVIEEQIEQNDETIKKVKNLVLESVNYIDNKSAKTQARLDSLTASLKELNESLK